MLIDNYLLSQRYFFPRFEKFENVYWVENEGIKLICYYFRKFEGYKTVVFFHGNGEVVADYISLFTDIFDDLKLLQQFFDSFQMLRL